jgi:TRAP transporter TAXI family solute receptor
LPRLVFALIAFLLLAGVGGAQAQPLGLGTSPQGTLGYQLGATLSKTLADTANLQSRVQPSSGTGTMIPLVNSGEIDFGFANAIEVHEAYSGTGTFQGRRQANLRVVSVLFPFRVGLFVRADSPIKSLQDLKGRTISYGYASQEIIRFNVDAMLANAGLTINDMRPVLVPNLIRGVDELIAGRVEVTTFAIGSAKVAEADAAIGGVRYLPLRTDAAAVSAMQKVLPLTYIEVVQPAPNLPGVREPLPTMHYDYTIFANADVPPDKVRAVARAFYENRDAMTQSVAAFKDMNLQRIATAIGVPFHEGALSYYRDKGVAQAN